MSELLTAAQMRAIEQAAIESGEVTGLGLMERAGQGVVEAIFEEWPELDTPKMAHGTGLRAKAARWRLRRVAETPRFGVLCGPGNTGGDGFVIAKLLADRGLKVEVFFLGPPSKQPPDARKCAVLWYKKFKQLHAIRPLGRRDMRLAETKFDVFVDAVFGTGLDRPLPEEVVELFNNIRYERNWQTNRLVAVDILS
ncbi:NAD(P)H-hydrate epimerase [Shimia sp. Alg240-R146]|uniref:NAD(P)H-hydrate epimerase n=1 Tax=Shimia sp. Alg240-R146 TaxID=2993449 RepID=UPI0022E082D5|nr:NAD(P)H-hydrate epimerase [Shimia sp. Alg240-R146]